MERRLHQLKFLASYFLLFSFFLFLFFPQKSYSQELKQQNSIQLNLWAPLDAYPESYESEIEKINTDKPFAYPINQIKELSAFLLEGMIYGWEFDYTPSDKMRGVSEYFERKSIKPLGNDAKNINYKTPAVEDGKLYVWIEFLRTQGMISYLKYWEAVGHDKTRGHGEANLEKGFAGIKEACDLALKDAVREYFRTQVKNKPKQITGKVLLRKQPRISAISGKYVVDLDFFVEKGTIIQYRQF